ncbi:unnamed protein product [Amaranthus hypochondriacus]
MKPQKVKHNFFTKLLKMSSNNPKYNRRIADEGVTTYPYQMSMSTKYCCMLMRLSIDCKGCYKKLRRTILNMKEVETHAIERQYNRVSVCGRFRPSDVAIKMRKRMNRRVEILEIQEFDDGVPHDQAPQPVDNHPSNVNDHPQYHTA